EEDHHHHLDNPHYWGSPDNVKTMARNILTVLVKLVSNKKLQLTRNYNEYIKELDQICTGLKAKVAGLPDKRVVSYSAAFPYFYQYFGFENLATVESTCEQEISPKRLAEIAKLIKEKQVKVLVGESVYPKLPENLAQETAAKLVLLWPGTNEAEDYPATLKENVEKLVNVLQ
ncbi:MAG TPA: metal ABC transporter substrate-binding protein, partial [Bacillota bacterium]|nr:metal ABC transporter substrate-binding protein [Bacillota bacterium]